MFRLGKCHFMAGVVVTLLVFYQASIADTRGLVRYDAPLGGSGGLSGSVTLYERSHAIVIGIDRYKRLPDLQGSVRDARNVARAMRARGMQVKSFLNEEATEDRITAYLGDELPNRLGSDDRVLVYFAGHGVSVGEGALAMGYLMPYEGDRERVRSTGISMRELQAWFAGYPSKHVMFVADACYSGLALSTRSLGLSTRLPDYLRQVKDRPVRLALTAGGAGEEVHEWRGQGLFTYFFLKGIDGAADVNGDRIVTGDELVTFIKPNVTQTALSEFRAAQHPQVGRRGEGEFLFLAGTQVIKDYRKGDLGLRINYLVRRAGRGPLRSFGDGDTLYSGDHYKIVFTPDEDVYVYIFQLDTAGQIFQLFPMREFKGVRLNNTNPVLGGRRITLPAPSKAFRLDRQTGRERIYLLATRQRNEQLERLTQDLRRARKGKQSQALTRAQQELNYYLRSRQDDALARGVEDIVTDKDIQVEWNPGKKTEQDLFTVLERRLENLCSGCTHVLEFTHR